MKKVSGSALVPFAPVADLTKLDPEIQVLIDANAAALSGGGGWPMISTRGGVFSVGDIETESFTGVVLDACRTNIYYDPNIPYNPQLTESPLCYAIGDAEENLAPPAELKTRQADKCAGCIQNAFGSAPGRKGKACKNYLSLAVLDITGQTLSPELFEKRQGYLLRVNPTSKGAVQAELKSVLAAGVPLPYATIEFECAPDKKTQIAVTATKRSIITGPKVRAAICERIAAARTELRRPMGTKDHPTAVPQTAVVRRKRA